MKPEIEIITESENAAGWAFQARIFDDGKTYDFNTTLSWQDYELWCKGKTPPSAVITAAFEFLLNNEPASAIMTKFDCSIIRRYFPAVDQTLPTLIKHNPSL